MKLTPGEVTAIIAVKNGAATIEETLESLVNQVVRPTRIVIVDDCSTDNTYRIVHQFIDGCPLEMQANITVVKLEKNAWVYAARNIGAKLVGTEYMFFLDADDMVDPTYIESMLAQFDELNADDKETAFVYCQHVHFGSGIIHEIFDVPEFDVGELLQRNYVAYSSMMLTEAFNKLGGYSEYLNDCRSHTTEWDFWLRMTQNGYKGLRNGKPLFLYRRSSDQMSGNYERTREDMYIQMVTRLDDSICLADGGRDRILLVCNGRDYLDWQNFGFEVYTWLEPLGDFGEVYTFFYDVEMHYYGQAMMNKNLVEYVKRIKPKYIFHPAFKEAIDISTWLQITERRETDAIVWFSDDDRRFDDYSSRYAQGFSTIMTTYEDAFRGYNSLYPEKRVFLSQWAANVNRYSDAIMLFDGCDRGIDVSFFGQPYQDRGNYIMGVIARITGNHKIRGKGWGAYAQRVPFPQFGENLNTFITFPEMVADLQDSKISLNFSKGIDGRLQLKMRPFEICACGALCLTEYSPGLEDYFRFSRFLDPGEISQDDHIVVFKNEEDMLNKIDYLLDNDGLRISIAKSGFYHVKKYHSWQARFKTIQPIFGEGEKGNGL
jgi:glycosyltransferase involved in cell wall biosynthesis